MLTCAVVFPYFVAKDSTTGVTGPSWQPTASMVHMWLRGYHGPQGIWPYLGFDSKRGILLG